MFAQQPQLSIETGYCSDCILQQRSLQPLLPLPPIRHGSIEKAVERRCVVVFNEVAEFVGDDVVDAGWACLDQLQVQ